MAGIVASVENIGLDTIEYNISRFVQVLRHLGVRVSLAETVDAMAALGVVDLLDRNQVKAVLKACLTKNRKDSGIFDHAFNLFFVSPEVKAKRRERMLEAQAEKDRKLDLAEQQLREAVNNKDMFDPRTLTDEHLETFSLLPDKAKKRILDTLEKMKSNPINNPGELINRVIQSSLNYWRYYMMKNKTGKVEFEPEIEACFTGDSELDDIIGSVAAQFYHHPGDQLLHKDMASLDDCDVSRMTSLINHLSSRLSRSISRRYTNSSRPMAIDIRKTVRRNIKYGGIPIELRYRARRRQKPRLMLFCDVSGSMAKYARFVMQFIYGLNNAAGSIESFIFSEDLEKITGYFAQNRVFTRSMTEVVNNSRQWGKSTNLYISLKTFYDLYQDTLTPDTLVFIVSDARTVEAAAAADLLKGIKRRCSDMLWLNPLPKKEWETKPQIKQFNSFIKMYQCNTLWHLEKAIRQYMMNNYNI